MGVVERVMAFLAAAVMVVLAAAVAALILGWDAANMLAWFDVLSGRPLEGAVVVIFLGLGGAYFTAAALRRGTTQGVRWQGELGNVDVSLSTVEALAQQAASQVEGIKDLSTSVTVSGEGLQVELMLHVLPDRSIPALASQVQEKVSHYIEEIVGVPVAAAQVNVKGISASKEKARVQ